LPWNKREHGAMLVAANPNQLLILVRMLCFLVTDVRLSVTWTWNYAYVVNSRQSTSKSVKDSVFQF
jgi:hypothetical protein